MSEANELIEQIGGRDRLEGLASFKPSGSNDVNSASRDEWMAMARALLAVLDAKKVGFVESKATGTDSFILKGYYRSGINIGDELYAAPPSTSVSALKPDREAFIAWVKENFGECVDTRLALNGDGNDWMGWDMGCMWRVWRYLTTPPATSAPDGWIGISKQMPGEDNFLVFTKKEVWFKGEQVTRGFVCEAWLDEGRFFTNTPYDGPLELEGVTHWMPMPAAPAPDQ